MAANWLELLDDHLGVGGVDHRHDLRDGGLPAPGGPMIRNAVVSQGAARHDLAEAPQEVRLVEASIDELGPADVGDLAGLELEGGHDPEVGAARRVPAQKRSGFSSWSALTTEPVGQDDLHRLQLVDGEAVFARQK